MIEFWVKLMNKIYPLSEGFLFFLYEGAITNIRRSVDEHREATDEHVRPCFTDDVRYNVVLPSHTRRLFIFSLYTHTHTHTYIYKSKSKDNSCESWMEDQWSKPLD